MSLPLQMAASSIEWRWFIIVFAARQVDVCQTEVVSCLEEVNSKSKVTLKFCLKLGLKPNSSAKTEFKTEVKTELWF